MSDCLAVDSEGEGVVCLSGGIAYRLLDDSGVGGLRVLVSAHRWVEYKGQLNLGGEDGVLGDESNLPHHLQRVQDVDRAPSDGGAGREGFHGARGTLDPQH